jgi:hypothetical protein
LRTRKSWPSLVSNTSSKFLCSQRLRWILTNVFLCGHLRPGHLSWYNDEPSQHYRPPNRTWNSYRLAFDLSISSRQLAVTTHLTQNSRTSISLLLRFRNFIILCRTDTATVLMQRMTQTICGSLRNSIYHSAVSELINSEIVHFRTYVHINYYLRMRNSFLKLCRVFLKHSELQCRTSVRYNWVKSWTCSNQSLPGV